MTLREVHREVRLGAPFRVDVDAPGRLGDEVLAAVLAEVTRLEAIFDPVDPASEFRRWRRGEVTDTLVSTDLAHVLAASERYRVFSKGAFHPGAEPLVRRWREAERRGLPPTRDEMAELARSIELPYTAVNGPITRTGDCSGVDLNSIARGYIVDRALEAGWRLGLASGLCVDAAGDRRHLGASGVEVSLPDLLGVEAEGLDEPLLLRDAALSHLSRQDRGFVVGGVRYGDLLDPSTGWPSEGVAAVATLAPDAMTADVLATVIGVGRLPAGGGLPGCAWLAVTADGRVLRSTGWPRVGGTTSAAPAADRSR
nr:hypothetical protein [Propionibacterium sp.]